MLRFLFFFFSILKMQLLCALNDSVSGSSKRIENGT